MSTDRQIVQKKMRVQGGHRPAEGLRGRAAPP